LFHGHGSALFARSFGTVSDSRRLPDACETTDPFSAEITDAPRTIRSRVDTGHIDYRNPRSQQHINVDKADATAETPFGPVAESPIRPTKR
jgi:hypothetical protein